MRVNRFLRAKVDLLTNLKFDESDPILGSIIGELSCIFALITGNNRHICQV